jgi:hypothetical protein
MLLFYVLKRIDLESFIFLEELLAHKIPEPYIKWCLCHCHFRSLHECHIVIIDDRKDAMKVWKSGGSTPCILNLAARWR